MGSKNKPIDAEEMFKLLLSEQFKIERAGFNYCFRKILLKTRKSPFRKLTLDKPNNKLI
jgi:hypothetical protein